MENIKQQIEEEIGNTASWSFEDIKEDNEEGIFGGYYYWNPKYPGSYSPVYLSGEELDHYLKYRNSTYQPKFKFKIK